MVDPMPKVGVVTEIFVGWRVGVNGTLVEVL